MEDPKIQTCVGCGTLSPKTETRYTLISAKFKWRLTRQVGPDGVAIAEWRCPPCWDRYKAARQAGGVSDVRGKSAAVIGAGKRQPP